MFLSSCDDLLRTVVVGMFAYAGLILTLRISGKRTLSKMNAFDLVVTVSLGSILATALLSKQTALAEVLTAFATLIGLQFIVAWLSARYRQFGNFVKAQPRMLLYRGKFLHEAMLRERVTEGEVLSAIRAQGVARIEDVEAVVLETDGSFTAIGAPPEGKSSSLTDVKGPK